MSTATIPPIEPPRHLTVRTLTLDQARRLIAQHGRPWRWPSGRIVRAAFLDEAFRLLCRGGGPVDAAAGWGLAIDQDERAEPYVVSPSITRLWSPLAS